MPLTRVYLPLTVADVRALGDSGLLDRVPLTAHAVTDEVRSADPSGDEEAWEYTALCEAADHAAALRLAPGDPRVVAAADVEPGCVEPDCVEPPRTQEAVAGSSVRLTDAVPRRRIASFHVDGAGSTDEDELLWYDVTELSALLEAFGDPAVT